VRRAGLPRQSPALTPGQRRRVRRRLDPLRPDSAIASLTLTALGPLRALCHWLHYGRGVADEDDGAQGRWRTFGAREIYQSPELWFGLW